MKIEGIFKGSPDDVGRLKKETDTYRFLDSLGVHYLRVDHEETATIEACREVEERLGIEILKNLFLCNSKKTSFYLLMMPGRKKFITKELSKQLGLSRLSFADGEFMEAFLDIEPGSVSVLGLKNDIGRRVQLLVDREITKSEFFGCHPCVNTSSLKIKTKDLFETILPATGHEPIFVEL